MQNLRLPRTKKHDLFNTVTYKFERKMWSHLKEAPSMLFDSPRWSRQYTQYKHAPVEILTNPCHNNHQKSLFYISMTNKHKNEYVTWPPLPYTVSG